MKTWSSLANDTTAGDGEGSFATEFSTYEALPGEVQKRFADDY
ncbi:MAG: hypothetical protein ACI9FD_000603 [Gammaproteobacteria bacterium]|jgi:hypothetical protein